ncbi:MAG: SH3 domain-containing protein [Lachnospiraceae bacterium]|nr:SH3 domain-containing protein [Lachnospiraceae bacterium]
MEWKSRFIATLSLLIVFAAFLICCIQNQKEYPKKMQVAFESCKVRSGPGTTFELVTRVDQGELVIVLGIAEDTECQTWYLLDKKTLPKDIEAEECYIRSDLLTNYDDDLE